MLLVVALSKGSEGAGDKMSFNDAEKVRKGIGKTLEDVRWCGRRGRLNERTDIQRLLVTFRSIAVKSEIMSKGPAPQAIF